MYQNNLLTCKKYLTIHKHRWYALHYMIGWSTSNSKSLTFMYRTLYETHTHFYVSTINRKILVDNGFGLVSVS
jgi:hypothetical protein